MTHTWPTTISPADIGPGPATGTYLAGSLVAKSGRNLSRAEVYPLEKL